MVLCIECATVRFHHREAKGGHGPRLPTVSIIVIQGASTVDLGATSEVNASEYCIQTDCSLADDRAGAVADAPAGRRRIVLPLSGANHARQGRRGSERHREAQGQPDRRLAGGSTGGRRCPGREHLPRSKCDRLPIRPGRHRRPTLACPLS